MQLADTGSWRLSAGGSQACELALFVRDAARLPMSTRDVPALIGDVPDLTKALQVTTRQTAADHWQQWWQQLVDFEIQDRLARQADARARAHELINQRRAVFDPPQFQALADRPALRAAAQASFDRFREWESARRPPHPAGRPESLLDSSLMKQVAEEVAFDREVRMDAVQARVVVLPVHGVWWQRQAPGVVLSSPAAARDPLTAHTLLHDAFDSHVRRTQ